MRQLDANSVRPGRSSLRSPAVTFDDRLDDRQAQPAAAVAGGPAGVHLVEPIEDVRQVIGGDAAALVGHRQTHGAVAAPRRAAPRCCRRGRGAGRWRTGSRSPARAGRDRPSPGPPRRRPTCARRCGASASSRSWRLTTAVKTRSMANRRRSSVPPPLSRRARSSRSCTMRSSRRVSRSTVSRYRSRVAASDSTSGIRSVSRYPRIVVNGVRSSCETSASICRRCVSAARRAASRAASSPAMRLKACATRAISSPPVSGARDGQVAAAQPERGVFERRQATPRRAEDHPAWPAAVAAKSTSVPGSDNIRPTSRENSPIGGGGMTTIARNWPATWTGAVITGPGGGLRPCDRYGGRTPHSHHRQRRPSMSRRPAADWCCR